MRHKLLRISSKDRDDKKDSTSNFSVNVNNVGDCQKVRSIVVKQVSIPFTFYNINASNNRFTWKKTGVNTSFVLPVGQYNVSSFMAAMQAEGTAIGLTMVQNPLTRRFTITTTTTIEYLDIRENVLAEVLGIKYGEMPVEEVLVFNATGVPALSITSNVFIESNSLGDVNLIRTSGHSRSTLACIPITVPWGVVEQYVSSHSEIDDIDHNTHGGKSVQHIDIRITDHNGVVVDLNGHHVSIILVLYY